MKIPLAIIGCGGHARHHALHYLSHFTTEAVWDTDPDSRASIPSQLQANTIEELLASDAKAVMICSPDEFHLAQIELALKAGKHVFCEKPLLVPGQSIHHLEALFKVAELGGLVLTSCHPRRYDKPMRWLMHALHSSQISENEATPRPTQAARRLIASLGQAVGFTFDFSYHVPTSDWKHSRSLLLDHLNHEVDLMNMLFGIHGFDAWKLHDGPNRYAVAGKRDDAIVFQFHGTRQLKTEKYPEWCAVRFERGEVKIDMMTGTVSILDHDSGKTATYPGLDIDYSGRLCGIMEDFAKRIMGQPTGPESLTMKEMLMNTEAGIVLQQEGIQRISVR